MLNIAIIEIHRLKESMYRDQIANGENFSTNAWLAKVFIIDKLENKTLTYMPSYKLTSNNFFCVDLRVFLTGAVTAGAGAAFLPDRVRRAPSVCVCV